MTLISAKLLGTPIVRKDKEDVVFPYGKAEALFYYMLVKKRSSRDVLVDLFWSNIALTSAKKNLRNAVYIIKKVFNEEILISPQRTIVELNSEMDFELDIDRFLNDCGDSSIKAYSGEFLEGFFVKDASCFEEWMLALRNQYRDNYVQKLYKEIESFSKNKKWNEAEKYSNKIIDIDPFDENAYRVQMKLYDEMGKYNKCINIYNNLVKLLDKELSIAPDIKTTELFERIVRNKTVKQTLSKDQSKEFFYGRDKEISILNENYYKLINNNNPKSIIILGEAGIGKSKLLNRFLESISESDSYYFISNCYQAEEKFLLKPWNNIFQQLSTMTENERLDIPVMLRKIVGQIFPTFILKNSSDDVNLTEKVESLSYDTIEKTIVEIFKRISKTNKIILAFDDLQWIDSMSLALLKNIILSNKNKSIIVIATCRNGHGENIDNFLAEMGMYETIRKLNIDRFNKKETIDFITKMMPDHKLPNKTKDIIYSETEGNPLFIVELLNSMKDNDKFKLMTPKLKDVLRNRFFNVSKEGRKILNIASAFFDKVTFEDLQQITLTSDLEFIEVIEELQSKYLIKELIEGNKISFVFTHQKLREFIYSQLSFSKRRLLHNKIADLLEKQLKDDSTDSILYSRLIYHYYSAGNKALELKYRIKNLDGYLNLCHEVFPVIDDTNRIRHENPYLKKEFTSELSKISELLREVENNNKYDENIKFLEISFLHILARYYIMKGEYDTGLKKTNEMIEKSLILKDYESALKGYMKIIYYCINTRNNMLMSENIRKAFKITKKHGQRGQIGILLRLKGLQKIMEGKYSEGERLLKNSINIFRTVEDKEKYISNIAASHNYIGDSKRYRKEFKQAIAHYEKAIVICEDKGLIGGLAVANTNAGQAAYDKGDFEKAKVYLQKAITLYQQFDLVWARSTANGFYTMLLVREGKCDEAIKYLKNAEKFSDKVKSSYEKGLMYRVKAEISMLIEKKNIKCKLSQYLNESIHEYCDKGIAYLEDINGSYEIEILKEIRNYLRKI
ncbi:AAA family ATPase [Wukongibacter sp. M2B1]|uniref:AAA family ATPase n=1 Tax=Wukongibacter sp. M2B1 TaxID=3088895 RepID=UPI003D78E1E8